MYKVELTDAEKQQIMDELEKVSSSGYVGPEQFKRVIKKLRADYVLSDVDEKNLREKILELMQK